MPPPGGLQAVLAQVGRHPQKPGPLVVSAFKGGGPAEQLHQGVLEHLLCLAPVVEIGVGQMEDGRAVGLQCLFHCRIFHLPSSFPRVLSRRGSAQARKPSRVSGATPSAQERAQV